MSGSGQSAGPRRDQAPPDRPTSRDVAALAGVSQATVSLVLRGQWRGRVSAARADSVRSAARELGYRPNLAARNLRMGQQRTALLVVPALTTEFFARVHSGAAGAAAAHGAGVVLYPSPGGLGPAPDPFSSASATLDGVIASSMAADALAVLRAGGLPLVMLDSEPDREPAVATVNPDVADGMRQVAGHLLELGHRRITHLAAAVPSWTFEERAGALHRALDGWPGCQLQVMRAALTVRDGMAAAERALAASRRPTALVCDDDVLAAGACKAARRMGLRIPEDVSVTGFDDLSLATAVEPEITTVRLPAEEMGAAGLNALLTVRAGQPAATTVLPVELVRRGSSGPPPHAAGR